MKFKFFSFWKIYAVLYASLAAWNLSVAFEPDSSMNYLYYHTLMAFNKAYIFQYYFYVLKTYLFALACLPLILFAFQSYLLPSRLWQIIWWARIVFDFLGSFYEFKFLQSVVLTESLLGAIHIITLLVILFPSYLGTYLYVFRPRQPSSL